MRKNNTKTLRDRCSEWNRLLIEVRKTAPGIPDYELEKRLGLCRTTLTCISNGTRSPTQKSIDKLKAYLNEE